MVKILKNKIMFYVDDETYAKVKALPREFNLSEPLRTALDRILKKQSGIDKP